MAIAGGVLTPKTEKHSSKLVLFLITFVILLIMVGASFVIFVKNSDVIPLDFGVDDISIVDEPKSYSDVSKLPVKTLGIILMVAGLVGIVLLLVAKFSLWKQGD